MEFTVQRWFPSPFLSVLFSSSGTLSLGRNAQLILHAHHHRRAPAFPRCLDNAPDRGVYPSSNCFQLLIITCQLNSILGPEKHIAGYTHALWFFLGNTELKRLLKPFQKNHLRSFIEMLDITVEPFYKGIPTRSKIPF
ncbi:unnamed protein product [Allacma fusca]|uniref:Uncharacterized protein n=1 Tax=Allacma fusca TaxID=39272 RepID=A0A8J2P7T1_9HEXA|nr:unnamed protein product [Allacma fusca]